MAEQEGHPAATVAFGEQAAADEQRAAAEAASGVATPHRPGYVESPSHVAGIAAEDGAARPQRITLSEE